VSTTFSFNSDNQGWHYAWQAQSRQNTEHELYVFIMAGTKNSAFYTCVCELTSPTFNIQCRRKTRKITMVQEAAAAAVFAPRPVPVCDSDTWCDNPQQLVLRHFQHSKSSVVNKEGVDKEGVGKQGDDAQFLANLEDTLISLAAVPDDKNIGQKRARERMGEKKAGVFSMIAFRRPPYPQFMSKIVGEGKEEKGKREGGEAQFMSEMLKDEHSISLSTSQEPSQDREENTRLSGTTTSKPFSLRSLTEPSQRAGSALSIAVHVDEGASQAAAGEGAQ
jgi:hypothetical protein